jgi:hypothetical protein
MADTLRIALPADPAHFDPAYWRSTSDQLLINNLYPRFGQRCVGRYVEGRAGRGQIGLPGRPAAHCFWAEAGH